MKVFIDEVFSSDIMADNRKLENIFARTAFSNLLLSVSKNINLEEIGSFINRDHSSITHLKKVHKNEIATNPDYREKYAIICEKFPKSMFDGKEIELNAKEVGFRRKNGKPIFYGLNSKYTFNANHFSTKQLRAIADYMDANPELL